MPEEDEPFWSRHRLFNAFCLWLWFAIERKRTQPLVYKLKYYRRPYAAYLREKENK